MFSTIKNIIYLFYLLFAANTAAQQMNFVNMSNALNLASQECYNVMQDSKGYMWFCTDAGLCRYNGESTKIFSKNEGLPEGAVYYINEYKDSTIWAVTSKNRIIQICDGKLKEAFFSKNYIKSISNTRLTYLLQKDKNNNFIVNIKSNAYKIDHRSGKVTLLKIDADINGIIVNRKDEFYLIKKKRVNKPDESLFRIYTDTDTINIKVPVINDDFRVKCYKSDGRIFYNLNNILVIVEPSLKWRFYKMPSRILSVYPDSKGGLWVGLFQKGLRYYKDAGKIQNPVAYLPEYSVTGTFMDREDGVWLTTLEKGVFYCKNSKVDYFPEIKSFNKYTSLLKNVNDTIFVSSEADNYYRIFGSTIEKNKISFSRNTTFNDLIRFKNKWYFGYNNFLARLDNHFHFEKYILPKDKIFSFGSYQLAVCNDKLYSISFSEIGETTGNDYKISIPLPSLGRNFLCYDNRHFLVGFVDGLGIYDTQTNTLVRLPGISTSILKLFVASNGMVWVATRGEGLFQFVNGKAVRVNFGNYPMPDIINDITEDRYKTIWTSTDKGLLKIRNNNGLKAQLFTAANGLIANSIKQIAVDSKKIYISTIDGLCTFPLTENLINKTPPLIYLSTITVNDSVGKFKNRQIVLPHDKNSIHFAFDVLTYKTGSTPKLLYQLSGINAAFKQSQESTLHFDNLPPDNYMLIVYGLNNDGMKSLKPIIINFTIRKPFWLTTWFIIACVLFFLGTLYFFIKKYTEYIAGKEQEKTTINKMVSESQLAALQSQMNPHFIFNAINSIQNYVLKNKEKLAYDYLAKFSKLIRMVLNNSHARMLSLEKEIETLSLYVELEQLRFKESFEFRFNVNEKLDIYDLTIPTMLIQPYLENAIWHGLMNLDKERKGLLKLEMNEEDNLLHITIEDNGIGRQRSEAYKKDNLHRPVAMGLTEQRIQMVNSMHGYAGVKVVITDLYDASNLPKGTRVDLWLPLTTEL